MKLVISLLYDVSHFREHEAAIIQERDESVPGHEWERICRLCEFNPKHSGNKKDVSRQRSILLQLKQAPLVRWMSRLPRPRPPAHPPGECDCYSLPGGTTEHTNLFKCHWLREIADENLPSADLNDVHANMETKYNSATKEQSTSSVESEVRDKALQQDCGTNFIETSASVLPTFSHTSDSPSGPHHADVKSSCISKQGTSQNHAEPMKLQSICPLEKSMFSDNFVSMKSSCRSFEACQSPRFPQWLKCAQNPRWRPLICKYHYRYCDFKVDILKSSKHQVCSMYPNEFLAFSL